MSLGAAPPSKIRALYNSLDPSSLSQHLAFYELYGETLEGQKALVEAWTLLAAPLQVQQGQIPPFAAFSKAVKGVIDLVNKPMDQATVSLTEAELALIERLAARLPNRNLRGRTVTSEEEVLALAPNEIDLARGLLLSQLPDSPQRLVQIRSYEALLDLMALQCLTHITLKSSPEEKIRALNTFIFDEMGYRFPPHSTYAKDIDLYTFLPSVLDSRRGVCLGVSILYLSLGQRLNLPLEVITPPGHIYVRYHSGDKTINIETTARGIHIDSEHYLGVDTRSLEQRNIKEVIGLAHFNQAAVFWRAQQSEKALEAYAKASPYLPDDMLVKEFTAYHYLFTQQEEKALPLLYEVKDHLPDYAVSKQTVAEDYLKGAVDAEGIRPLFMHVDETRASILDKRKALENTLEHYPTFRAGLFALATTWLQLHRMGEALALLEKLHTLDPTDPDVEYYLAQIYAERLDYNKAWNHLRLAEKITQARDHHPKALKELRKELAKRYPE